MKREWFEDYLKEVAREQGVFDGVFDDDMENVFERWINEIDVNQAFGYAEQWGAKLQGADLLHYKNTHDLRVSTMSPTYCDKCKKSGYQLNEGRCKYAK